jgi:hypothetical protein
VAEFDAVAKRVTHQQRGAASNEELSYGHYMARDEQQFSLFGM